MKLEQNILIVHVYSKVCTYTLKSCLNFLKHFNVLFSFLFISFCLFVVCLSVLFCIWITNLK